MLAWEHTIRHWIEAPAGWPAPVIFACGVVVGIIFILVVGERTLRREERARRVRPPAPAPQPNSHAARAMLPHGTGHPAWPNCNCPSRDYHVKYYSAAGLIPTE